MVGGVESTAVPLKIDFGLDWEEFNWQGKVYRRRTEANGRVVCQVWVWSKDRPGLGLWEDCNDPSNELCEDTRR